VQASNRLAEKYLTPNRRYEGFVPSNALRRPHTHPERKRERGEVSLALARPGALVFSDLEGGHLHPEWFWRTWKATVARCRAQLGEDAPR
jgi:hypothetical protein